MIAFITQILAITEHNHVSHNTTDKPSQFQIAKTGSFSQFETAKPGIK